MLATIMFSHTQEETLRVIKFHHILADIGILDR